MRTTVVRCLSPLSTRGFLSKLAALARFCEGFRRRKRRLHGLVTRTGGAPSHMDAPHNLEDDDKISRWQISPSVLVVLQQVYSMDPFPSTEVRQQLASKLKAHPRQIQTWFQNRRARERRLGGTVQRPPATPMVSVGPSDYVGAAPQGTFSHDPYMDAFARQLQQQPQMATGMAQQLPVFPHASLESSLTNHLRQAVVDSLKTGGGGIGGGEGGGSDGGCGARALSMAALQGVAPGAFPPGLDSASLIATQVRPCTGSGGMSMPQATAQAFPSIWQQTTGVGALPPLQGEMQFPGQQQQQTPRVAHAQQAHMSPAMEMTRSGISGPLDALALLSPSDADPTCPLVAAVAADPPSGLLLDGKPQQQANQMQQFAQLQQQSQQLQEQQQVTAGPLSSTLALTPTPAPDP